MELETAIATALEQQASLLYITTDISVGDKNKVFHSGWDNFDALLTGLHGRPSIHMSAGIMLQEKSDDIHMTDEASTSQMRVPRTGEKSFKSHSASLPPFNVSAKRGPSMTLIETEHPNSNIVAREDAKAKYLIWLISRMIGGREKQVMPGFGGFISATGILPSAKTTLGYYETISEPITEYNAVREVLKRCQAATKEVGQDYTIVTFDLGVVMKAMPIIW